MKKAKCCKNLKSAWHSWATTEHHSETEFCQTTNTSDFKLGCVKMFLRKS